MSFNKAWNVNALGNWSKIKNIILSWKQVLNKKRQTLKNDRFWFLKWDNPCLFLFIFVLFNKKLQDFSSIRTQSRFNRRQAHRPPPRPQEENFCYFKLFFRFSNFTKWKIRREKQFPGSPIPRKSANSSGSTSRSTPSSSGISGRDDSKPWTSTNPVSSGLADRQIRFCRVWRFTGTICTSVPEEICSDQRSNWTRRCNWWESIFFKEVELRLY